MKIITVRDYAELSCRAAGMVAAQIIQREDSVLGLATGSTPTGMYGRLAELHQKNYISFSQAASVNLDEYLGLAPSHPQSYRYYMEQNLFGQVDILPRNTHVPNGVAPDPQAECLRYETVIRELGGIDLQVLGLGHNGHIGFNEPGDWFETGTHCVSLMDATVRANARFFDRLEDVPGRAITMGIKTIMQARGILLLVSGADKADILYRALYCPITPGVPASILQLHPRLTVIADQDALARIRYEQTPPAANGCGWFSL